MSKIKGRTTEDIFKRDMALFSFMRKRRGVDNIVGSKEIADFLESIGYPSKQRCIGELMSRIMYQYNAPIVYRSGAGYFWAKTSDEIRDTICDLQGRIDALNEHIKFLKDFIVEE